MSKQCLLRSASMVVTVLAVSMAAGNLPAQTGAGSAKLDFYTNTDGANYFALSLTPSATTPAVNPSDIVVLFDTSASQVGDFRSRGLAALSTLLAGLAPADNVQIMAVDLNAVPMNDAFVSPQSPGVSAALTKLNARVPLGATDMEKALLTAAGRFPADSNHARAVIYIGQGRSPANLLNSDRFQKLIETFVEKRIPVVSYAVGPRLDRPLLFALAGRTGGLVIDDSPQSAAEGAGHALASAAKATVFWPTSVQWPAEMAEVYPKLTPPLRSDRDTVVIGTLKGKAPLTVQMAADSASGPQRMQWTITPQLPMDRNVFLVSLVEQARADAGLTLPLSGSASLGEIDQAMSAGVRNIATLARQALDSGNFDTADKLVDGALKHDPSNPALAGLKDTIAKARQGGVKPAAGPAMGLVAPPPPAGPADGLNMVGAGAGVEPVPTQPQGAFAAEVDRERGVVRTIIQTEVQNAVNQARGVMGTDPEKAAQDLKLQLEKVRQAPELDPGIRDQLTGMIQAALREASRRQIEVEQRRQQQHETLAAAKERQLINENLLRTQQKVRQLMERFNSLMDEGRYRYAEEAAAVEMAKLAPDNPASVAATLNSRTMGYAVENMAVRVARQKGVVDVLAQVEKSHVPFPDEPPIVYPDSQIWQELSARRKDKYSSMDLAKRGTAEKKIDDALKSPTQLEFIETPLQDVIDYLKDFHDIEIQIDKKALDDVGIGSDTPVTKNLKGISLRSALRLMLKELGLTYIIKDEVLLITTPEEAEAQLSVKVYPVADLVLPIRSSGFTGGFGGLGGMGGGMGGMMGSGGMGSAGQGMGVSAGGAMGGGGGMGMFNLPRDFLNNVPKNGFQAFAVKDEVPAAKKAEAPAAEKPATVDAAKPASVGVAKPAKIEVELAPGADPQVVWEKYFTANQPEPAAIRDAVRKLMNEQRFAHVIALTQAALRHQQVQPWMYEAMSLAMQADGRPKEEIERAVMSAVDFCDTTADLLYVGAYLSHLGLDQRALQVFRQAGTIDPLRPEPYTLGLKAAQKVNDVEGIQWAVVGILSQAWPKAQQEVWQSGVRTAQATLEKLRAEKRSKDFATFEDALNRAVVRDVVVQVRWTGEADVDILVEEPSGSVCSLRCPRTPGGGVLLNDSSSVATANNADGYCETYVCPKGFSGTYKVLVRRVWGKVTAGKVSVEVLTHFRDKGATSVVKKITLDKDQAMLAFDLKDGRRKEALADQQLANAAAGQLAVNHQVLAQQLAGAVNPAALAALAAANGTGSDANNGGGTVNGSPFNLHGAVGYQPVIITLPEGTNFAAFAVISADRRYVRITCIPLFSAIPEVNTFNTSTGVGGSGEGTNGKGYSQLFGGGNQGSSI